MTQPPRCPQCKAELPADAPEGLCPKCLLEQGMETRHRSQDAPEAAAASPQGGAFEPPSPEELAPQFPHLEVLELLGHGGMGAVYKARQKRLDRLVALKIIRAEVAGDPAFAERFAREAQALARLSHPNIVAVYDFGEAGGLYYFIMEFVDGLSLRQMLQSGELQPHEALAIVPQICEALQFAHDEGIVHRDIKPENILLDKRGRVKIADFGLAKLLGRSPADFTLTTTGQVMGTPHYMAPEQIEHAHKVDHRADIYSLGVVFYEMLTGELPIGRFAAPSKKVQVDVRLDEVVLRALEKEPERRYQHVSEVKTEVETICGLPREAAQRIFGSEYRSKTTVFGVPLVHIAFGLDPNTGRARTAKGIIAIGDKAVGAVAFGGLAIGGVAVGGVACGLFALGGAVLGILAATGGLAVGGLSFGGMAVGVIAVGGGAIGVYAGGGWAWGMHVLSSSVRDPEAMRLFQQLPWARSWQHWVAGSGIGMPVFGALISLVIWLVFYRQNRRLQRERGDAGGTGGLPAREATSTFPFGHVQPNVGAVAAGDEVAADPIVEQVRRPAAGLLITGILYWATIPVACMLLMHNRLDHVTVSEGLWWFFFIGPALAGGLLIFGGAKMKRLELYRFAVFSAILPLAMLLANLIHHLVTDKWAFGPGDLIGAPMGLWALLVLTRREVKQAFDRLALVRPQPRSLPRSQARRMDSQRRDQHPSDVKADVDAIYSQVKGPATGLLITGILNWIGIPAVAGILVLTALHQNLPIPEKILPFVVLMAFVAGGLMIFAALKMRRLEAYGVAITSSILAMVVTPGNLVGFPIGIWALVVLCRKEVRAAFRQRRLSTGKETTGASAELDPARRRGHK